VRRLAREQADAQEMKNAETRGEFVRGDQIDLFVLALAGGFNQRMRAIPPKAAPEVRATASDAEGEAVLSEHIDQALDEMAAALREAGERAERMRAKSS
jgi:phage terminase Nu1 subunit (DNA packaging protein)